MPASCQPGFQGVGTPLLEDLTELLSQVLGRGDLNMTGSDCFHPALFVRAAFAWAVSLATTPRAAGWGEFGAASNATALTSPAKAGRIHSLGSAVHHCRADATRDRVGTHCDSPLPSASPGTPERSFRWDLCNR
jgi:hypothetical protein